MSLDYTQGCVNFRDVGEFINIIMKKEILQKGKLFRGGKIDFVESLDDINNPQSIINLRKGTDPVMAGIQSFHFPISNDYEKYDTSDKVVRRWLNEVICTMTDESLKFPILIHCTSGKDRTGVVIASILKILGIPEDTIIEEYLLCEGEVKAEWITQSLEGIADPFLYFNRVNNIHRLKERLLVL